MGPRFCKRGNYDIQFVRGLYAIQLQWGHAFVSVETKTPPGPSGARQALQWGHAFVSVETNTHFDSDWDAGQASMGPRFCKRGNRNIVSSRNCGGCPLQWGHAFVSVETYAPARQALRASACFNGATLL